MGRAIVREPALFLFDEPLSNLDAKLRVRMRLEIKGLQQRLGVTSLYVTHDQVEAMTLADRLIVLNDGRIEQIDTPLNIYQNPASVFVAGFIGTPVMNLIEGTLVVGVDGEGDRVKVGEELLIKISDNFSANCDSNLVTLGIRPDQVYISSEAEADIFCTVMAIETLGSETLAHCELLSGPSVKPSIGVKNRPFVVKLDGTCQLGILDVLPLAIKSEEIQLFQTTSGLNISVR